MAGKSLFLPLLGLVFILGIKTSSSSTGNASSPNCRVGKPLRKQIEVEPLDGSCLRDIVDRLSKTLRHIGNEELGINSFQETLDNLEFTKTRDDLNTRLKTLADRLNSKLKSYADLLAQSDRLVEPILAKRNTINIYSNPPRLRDICAEIRRPLSADLPANDLRRLHILPISHPGTNCGAINLAQNAGPLLLARCGNPKNVLLLVEHGTFMSERDVGLAQLTTKTLVEMLSDIDYVNVVGLAGHGLLHCPDRLLRATDINKIQLSRHIDAITRSDSNQTLDLDFGTLTRNLSGEILLIHLTNTLKDVSHVTKIRAAIAATSLVAHLRTVLILSDSKPRVNVKEVTIDETIVTLPTQNVLSYEIARLFSETNCMKPNTKEYYLSDPYFEPHSKTMSLSVGQITKAVVYILQCI